MKLFYEKHIFFYINIKKRKQTSIRKPYSEKMSNYMKKIVKKLAMEKSINYSSECPNRDQKSLIKRKHSKSNFYKMPKKENLNLFIEKLLIKLKLFQKNFIEN